jgi:hypothetical protein
MANTQLLEALESAAQLSSVEMAAICLLNDSGWLDRDDFCRRFVTGTADLGHAHVRWSAVAEALDDNDLDCTVERGLMLRIAASLGGAIPIVLMRLRLGPPRLVVGLVGDVAAGWGQAGGLC